MTKEVFDQDKVKKKDRKDEMEVKGTTSRVSQSLVAEDRIHTNLFKSKGIALIPRYLKAYRENGRTK